MARSVENIDTLVWPPYSPAISSIKKLWGALKYEVKISGTMTKLVEIWKSDKIQKNCKTGKCNCSKWRWIH